MDDKKKGEGFIIPGPEGTKEQIEQALERQAREEAKAKNEQTGPRRLNQLDWPKNWTRAQKRRCVQAMKRAVKKRYTPGSPEWDNELARAGFPKKKDTNEND